DRINCPSCGKKIVPRMVTNQGQPDKTLCPYCGTVIKKFENNHCLMLHLYGGRPHIHLDQLREFRDEKLLTNSIGKLVVKMYYKVSPILIEVIKNRQRIIRLIYWSLPRPT
ncbi:MAG: hypothetical protein PHQ90_04950, partial [Sulfuricurvum sp.]|nr:hypothetical protein [Sulfuricurvum sp.]